MKAFPCFFFFLVGAMSMTQAMDLSDVKSFSVNSIPVILRSTPSYGEIVAIVITARGGVQHTQKAGILGMMEQTISAGTYSFSKEKIDQILTESGAQFLMDTKSDYIEVSLKCLKHFLPTVLPVVAEMIQVPLLKPEEIELVRNQMLTHLKSEQDHPDSLLQLISHQAFYQNHPYGVRPEGYLNTIETITRDETTEILPKIFNNKNMIFTFVGKITEEEVKEWMATYFNKLPEGPRAMPIMLTPQNQTHKTIYKKFDSPTTYFLARFKAPPLPEEDYPALTLAVQVLDNRFFEEIRTKKGLTYAVSASLDNQMINSGMFYLTSSKLKESLKILFEEVEKIKTIKLDANRLELQIRKFISQWYMGRELSLSQAHIFSFYEILGLGWAASNTFIERLKKVTPNKVQEVAQKYFKDYTITVVGTEEISLPEVNSTSSVAASQEK